MTITQQNRYLDRPAPSSLADVIDTILDKGLVIDVYVRVSLVGIELITIDARIVIASVDTYLRFAQATSRLDLTETETHGIPELIQDISESGSKGKTSGALEGAKEKLESILPGGDEDSDEESEGASEGGRDDQGRKQSSNRARKSTSRRNRDEEG
ncbi:gas vesicle protein GvpJ [Nocardioides sp. NPDC057772]|uniref:gas vesicle protein GvpJ n=1 Tax=Nocardioides sp. NPDC057772 TaxID=3346245 RepID=UPI00366B2259